MQEFTSKDSKKILLDIIKPFFKKEGFKFISGGSPGFVKLHSVGNVDVIITFGSHASMGFVGFVPIRLYLKEVEVLLEENSYPRREMFKIGEGMFRITTIKDTQTKLYQSEKSNPINTEEKTLEFANSIINYIISDGAQFISHYSILPNVLNKIDFLIEYNRFPGEILSGGLDYWFRTLVISRLCNDLKYQDKVAFVDKNMYADNNEEWIPYYEKLKAKLANLEPRYNL